ncbi:DgyrCDS3188 [Dimorphilus gyrociliatus]|uniref:DgyrCDS3188 n=1 Tax=Dimorphilus gyrociliatus TaxID=2664684 RepID=A0A7I8VHI9_9ANNE|nr:DgyrCDS3188 [Dimorphilus gyrociliatus]
MHGLGDDFIIVEFDNLEENQLDYSSLAVQVCDRKFGIGADGLIIANPPEMKLIQFQMLVGEYLILTDNTKYRKLLINTLSGVILWEILDDGQIRVDMGPPILQSSNVQAEVLRTNIKIKDKEFPINLISMGNPHCVIFTKEDTDSLAIEYGPKIECHSIFPLKTNVEFVNIISNNRSKISIWERGCGITMACGTGACASVVAAVLNKLTEESVIVDLPGGQLKIDWNGCENSSVFMTGNAEFVCFQLTDLLERN